MSKVGDMQRQKADRSERGSFQRSRLVEGVDYIGVGVSAIVFDAASRLFLAKRGPTARNERHHWEFPGGAVRLHERLSEAVKREFLEEFGMHIEPESLLCLMDHILPAESQHWVSACFLARHLSGEPTVREAGKCLAVTWATPSDLPSPLALSSTAFLQAYYDAIGTENGPGPDQTAAPGRWRLRGYIPDLERGK